MKRPLLYCPAMNTLMWEHPITSKHVSVLQEMKYIQIPPVVKTLTCGDTGTVSILISVIFFTIYY